MGKSHKKESTKKLNKSKKAMKSLQGARKPRTRKRKQVAAKTIDLKTELEKVEIEEQDWLTPGVMYIGHLPHGFYEEEIMGYCSQFGKVFDVKVARSEKSGASKGYAFVHFKSLGVAKVVAENMNNYLMMDKVLKCHILPNFVITEKSFTPQTCTKRQHFAATFNENAKQKINTDDNDTVLAEKVVNVN